MQDLLNLVDLSAIFEFLTARGRGGGSVGRKRGGGGRFFILKNPRRGGSPKGAFFALELSHIISNGPATSNGITGRPLSAGCTNTTEIPVRVCLYVSVCT